MTRKTAVALTIAGSDSGAGAGVQADLKVFSALGVYGTCAITAITAQNTLGVRAVHLLPRAVVAAQIDAVFEDFNVGAVKIGMLGDVGAVEAVAAALARYRPGFVALDPVMIASSGDRLLAAEAVAAMKKQLFPLTDCLTPNLFEAAALLGAEVPRNEAEMISLGRAILALGPRAALMKGGHLEGAEAVDILVTRAGARRYPGARLASANLHGTGCALSAALAAGIARGRPLEKATEEAKSFVARAIEAGRNLTLGSGSGPFLQ